MEEQKKEEIKKEEPKKKKAILRNVLGKEVPECDYFYSTKGPTEGKAPATFNTICGLPVEREDLIDIFNKIFKVEDNFLFYKTTNKEVYLVIVPIKNSTIIGDFNESVDGDFQKHALSFISEGSVNLDTLKTKLKRILGFVKFANS